MKEVRGSLNALSRLPKSTPTARMPLDGVLAVCQHVTEGDRLAAVAVNWSPFEGIPSMILRDFREKLGTRSKMMCIGPGR